ncbi:MAG: mechanosensitive ion channel family protein [Francisellaceae bacterium]
MDISSIKQYLEWFLTVILSKLPGIIMAIIVLIIGLILVKILKKVLNRVFKRTHIEKTVRRFLLHTCEVFLIVIIIMIAISTAGIPTTPITGALMGILIGLGMSLRSSVSIIASGIMLVAARPFKIGEYVDIGGTSGTVEDINFIFCRLRMTDGREIKIANNLVMSRIITNFTKNDYRRNDFIIGISYESDLVKAKSILQSIVDELDKIIKTEDKPVLIRTDALADSSVNLIVRYWTTRVDFLETKWQITEMTKLRFDEQGINIPYPQRTIHMAKD